MEGQKDFQERLRRTFGYSRMSDIARQLGIPHATVRNYFGGRLPAADVLIKIAKRTNVSLNWLLTGVGDMYLPGAAVVDFEKIFEDKINRLIDARLAKTAELTSQVSAGRPAEFDVETAVRRWNDPERVMNEWFKFEGREYPSDYGVVFFQGWESYSDEEKIAAIHDAKSVLDRSLSKT